MSFYNLSPATWSHSDATTYPPPFVKVLFRAIHRPSRSRRFGGARADPARTCFSTNHTVPYNSRDPRNLFREISCTGRFRTILVSIYILKIVTIIAYKTKIQPNPLLQLSIKGNQFKVHDNWTWKNSALAYSEPIHINALYLA